MSPSASKPAAAEESDRDLDELRSRSDETRANRVTEDALARLSSDLCRLKSKKLAELELPEALVDAVLDAQAITSHAARNRQLRRVRSELRVIDWGAVQHRLTVLLETGCVPRQPEARAAQTELGAEARWVVRLLAEGAPGLEALLQAFPRADRTHLRQLVRNVEKGSHERRVKAERKLAEVLRGLLR